MRVVAKMQNLFYNSTLAYEENLLKSEVNLHYTVYKIKHTNCAWIQAQQKSQIHIAIDMKPKSADIHKTMKKQNALAIGAHNT